MTAPATDQPVEGVLYLDIDGMSLIEKIDKNPVYAIRNAKSTPREDLLLQNLHEAQQQGYDIVLLTARSEEFEKPLLKLEGTIGTKSTNSIKEYFATKGITIQAEIVRAPTGLKGKAMAKHMAEKNYTKGILIDDQLKQVDDVKKVNKTQNIPNMHAYDINSLSHLTKLRNEIRGENSSQSPFMSEEQLGLLEKKDFKLVTSLRELQNFVENPIDHDEKLKSAKSPPALQALVELEQRVALLKLMEKTDPKINLKRTDSQKDSTLVSYCDQLVKDLKWQYDQANKAGYEPDLQWIQKVSSHLTNVLQKHQLQLLEPKDIHGLFKAATERSTSILEKIQSISIVGKICRFFNIGKEFRAKQEAKEVDKSWEKIQKNEGKNYRDLHKPNSKSEANLLKVAALVSQPELRKSKSMPNLKSDGLTSAAAKGHKAEPNNHPDSPSINVHSYRGGKI